MEEMLPPETAAAGVHVRFARRAANTPDAVALAWDGGTLTYAELDARAARLAAVLRDRGVGPGGHVGFCLERGPRAVVTMLASLKAGAAFVPLDPAYPAERLAFMLADSGVRTLVTQHALASTLPTGGVDVLLLDEVEDALLAEPAADPGIDPGPEALAYVIYTSGSTGRPKGVGVTHRGLRNTARAFGGMLGVDDGSRFLQFASPGFDASVCEVFVALEAGAQLHLAPREALLPGPGLVRLLDERGITHVILPPSALAVLPWAELPALQTLIVAGEACPPELVRRWAPGRRFVNAYGPTEVAICATAGTCEPDGGTAPIGLAIDGATAHVLDEALRRQAEGELYVGGEGVARGYLGRPALTAERFVPDPFSDQPGARMYRTGDRVRGRADGRLEFVGRMDEQVKVRGYRVEPGEVADALAAHPALAHAAVVARADGGAVRLVAYAVPREGAVVPPVEALRAFLARTLPEHMVPSAFVALDALPLTPNGKVDRKALPAPPATRPALAAAYVPPRTPAERRVAAAWAEVLGMQGIGAEDGFLELGGHSLAATQVVARLRQAHGMEVPLEVVLRGGTVAQAARAARAADGADAAGLVPVERGGVLPISFSQERVWLLTELNPDNRSYHAHAVLVFRGALDVDALREALSAVVARHEIFRTTFPVVDGRPVQRIHAPWEVPLPVVDLGGTPAAEREEAAQGWMREEFARGFDLARLPLVHWTLLKVADDEHRLVHVEHHVVHDGWSFNVLLRDLLALYAARVEGRPSPLRPLPLQFADYAAFQRRWLESGEALRQADFWRERLAGSTLVLELPFDRPRPPEQRFRGAAPRRELPAALYGRLCAASRHAGVTLFATMMAAFDVLLWHGSGQRDLNVGTAIANRRLARTHDIIGMFVNSVVVRARLDGELPFAELARRVHTELMAAAENQELPFESVVEALRPARSLSHNPLFQVSFSFHDSPIPELRLPGVRVEVVPGLPNGSAKFDLNVIAIPRAQQRIGQGGAVEEDGITLIWEYSTDLFDPPTIERMVSDYVALLEAVAAEPETVLSRLPASMRADPSVDRPADRPVEAADPLVAAPDAARCIHHRVAEQAARTPDAPAVVHGDASLTYRALDARANQLAHHLRRRGVGPETRVGVCLERGVEMLVCHLAVLKAGGAYVPLDPAYPAERLAFMLADSAAAVLLTDEALRDRLPARGGTEVVCVDGGAAGIAAEREDAPGDGAEARGLAYVIYTSGSTGTPKGVAVEHASLANLCDWHAAAFGVTAADRATQVASPGFDAAAWEVWPYLARGACVMVAPAEVRAHPEGLRDWLLRQGATVSFAPTPVAEALLGLEWPAGTALRWLLAGGDRLRTRPGAGVPFAVSNNYGPTECTVVTTSGPVGREGTALPSIGAAVANTAVHVLDEDGAPVPAGELYVGGAQVARGYLGQPGRTAERFLPDPFSAAPGARMYRTGDRVRRRPDGALDFLGRADGQVKIRGFRIEPGEVEAALRRHPAVRECVVVAREDPPGEARLVAYVAGGAGADELRGHLRRSLPEHMVPGAFVAMEALPLTPNGKVDRRALPAPAPAEAPSSPAPRDALEARVAEAWRAVLRVPAVGVHDNFFDVGGTSMMLARVYAALREIRPELRMVDLFRHTTVEAQAAHLAAGLSADPDPEPRTDSADSADPARAGERRAPGGGGRKGARRPRRPARPFAPRTRRDPAQAIAVVGMSCRVPGARDVDALWRNLCAGVESIAFFSDDELLAAGVSPDDVRDPAYVRAYGALEDAYAFDAGFFGITPGEARMTDPQHRVFLECAWSALEDAGVDPARFAGAIGVYAGSKHSLHPERVRNDPRLAAIPARLAMLGSAADCLTTRVSYRLGLRGPSVAVQTGCSTSLVAIHLACRSLLGGECDLALAGGVNVPSDQVRGYRTQEGAYASPDGHCRAFDARAGGTVSGAGVGVVVLKRLSDALRDGDPVHAVVRGSAINNDGSGKIGFSAPSVEGQARVVSAALRAAGVEPGSIGYVEAHGTGTPLGDPVEIAALAEAFRGVPRQRVALGAVKTNFGHLEAAAGVAGFIKTVLALRHGIIPPTLHFQRPNPETGLDASPFHVNTVLRPWPATGTPRRAGVSSLGIGGTNAHVVLEEAPPAPAAAPAHGPELLVLSARGEAALERMRSRLAERLASGVSLADAAFTLREGRAALPHRWAAAVADVDEALAALAGTHPRRPSQGRAADRPPPVAFLFPGQGTLYPGVAAELYAREPVFRDEIDRCAGVLADELGADLRDVLFPPAGGETEAGRWGAMRIAQPALFAVEYALARLWMHRGVRPGALIGHSAGEYVAACLAGVFSLEDALRLVAARGRLLDTLPPGGAMLAVPLGEDEVAAMLSPALSLAAVNGPANCVVSGGAAEVDALAAALAERGVEARRLPIAQAGHSPAMDVILDAFGDEVRRTRRAAPRIPLVSNVTGDWMTAEQAVDPDYWVRHLRRTVRFSEGVGRLLEDPARVLLEVGPGETLGTFARRRAGGAERVIVHSLAPAGQPEPADLTMLDAAGALWTAGVPVDWAAVRGSARRRRVPLPTYPFQRDPYPVPPAVAAPSPAVVPDAVPALASNGGPAHADAGPAAAGEAGAAVRGRVTELFAGLLGAEPAALDPDASFLQLGADSLLLMQASRSVESAFRVSIPFRQLLDGLSTLRSLSAHLERQGPASAAPSAAPLVEPDAGDPVPSAAHQARIQAHVAGIFSRLLGTAAEVLDPTRTFLELGADSLLLMQASRDVENTFGVRIPFRDLLDGRSTLHELAAHLAAEAPAPAAVAEAASSTSAAIGTPASSESPAPASADVPWFTASAPPVTSFSAASTVPVPAVDVSAGVQELVARQLEIVRTHAALMQAQLELLRGAPPAPAHRDPPPPFGEGDGDVDAPVAPVPPSAGATGNGAGPVPVGLRIVADVAAEDGGAPAAPVPLSFTQERLWRLDRADPGNLAHNVVTAHRVEGALDAEALERALGEIVRRHEALRTTFGVVAGEPVQVIAPFTGFRLSVDDLRAVPPAEREAETARRIGVEAARPFDLAAGPLFRARLLRLAADDHVLVLCAHHAMMDGGSKAVLFRELAVLYAAFVEGRPSPLAPLPGRYADFAARQRAAVRGPALDRQLAYWRERLAGAPRELDLPTDHPRAQAQGGRGAVERATLPAELLGRLRQVGAGEGATPIMVLLAGWGALLGRYAAADDVVVGAPADRRTVPEVQGVIGNVSTLLPLRVGLHGDPAFREVLRRVRDAVTGAHEHPDLPFERVMEALQTGNAPRLQVMFVMHAAEGRALELRGTRVRRLLVESESATCELSLSADVESGEVALRYAAGLWTPATARRMLDDLRHLLERAAADPDARLSTLALRPREDGSDAGDADASRRADPGPAADALPLSFAQERLWFLDRMDPGKTVYNVVTARRLEGPLDVAALERALGEVVRRHAPLRSRFPQVDGAPVQVVEPFAGLRFLVEELSGPDLAAREAEARRRATEDELRPFDLQAGPVFRATLLRLGPQDHVLQFCLHHIVCDAWSLAVLLRELAALYGAFREGRPSPLPPLPAGYPDYVRWERGEGHARALAAQVAHWRERLAGAPPLLELPADRPRPAVQSYRGAYEVVAVPGGLLDRVRALAAAEGATPYMVLLAGFQALLARWCGTDDVVVASPVAGRAHAGVPVEGVIGLFVNTVAMRTRLDGDPDFREMVRRVRHVALDAFDHAAVPFEHLVRELRPERSLSHTPLVQVMFSVDSVDGLEGGLPGLRVSRVEAVHHTARLDLSLGFMLAGGGGGGVSLEYSTDLFDRSTMLRLADHLFRLLDQAAADPGIRLSALALAGEGEHVPGTDDASPAAWQETGETVHRLFEAQAARTPDAVALAGDGGAVTYARLDARANRLAHRLRRLGAGPEVRVGVCVPRGPELAVCMLAVLKAGAVYVPVDPAYPPERIAYLVRDSGAALLLVRDPDLSAGDARVVRLDDEDDAGGPEHAPEVDIHPHGAAYAVYTSGSTGRPKGVVVSHEALCAHLNAVAAAYRLTPADRVLAFCAISFDSSLEQVLTPLLAGASLAFRDAELWSAAGFADVVERLGITIADPPTAYWHALAADAPALARLRGWLRLMVAGGEALQPATVAAWHRAPGGGPLLNAYGPSEAVVTATLHVTRAEDGEAARVPVGTALGGRAARVLDGGMRPVADGLSGELYLGGVALARGYLGRPSLTAERFVPDPYAPVPGARMYRTGDRARRLPGGGLDVLGRTDAQVKIRGHRIEPGEVEAALRAEPGVADCAVVAREDGGERRLVAYVVGPAETEALRAALGRRLPEYMVPAAFVALDALPLSVNGKVDRAALPAPAAPAAGDDAARSPMEEVLGGIWARLLDRETVGRGDDFFALGGHSLLATRVASRVREVLGVELPVRALFEAPTLAALARRVEALRGEGRAPLPPVVPVERDHPLPLSFAQERLWFLDRMEPGSAFYNLPAALRLTGPLDVPALERALGEIVRRHEALRTVFAQADDRPVQVVAPFAGFALPMEDLSAVEPDARDGVLSRRASDEAARPFDLEAGPLFRARLLRLGDGDHALLLCMHHVASDEWSMGIFFRELRALYAAFAEGGRPSLPGLPVQYADYAAWQREQLRGEALEGPLAYWRARLAGAPALLELPTDHPRPAVQSYRGARERLELPRALLERLRGAGRAEGATLFMVLLGAFQLLLSRYGATGDVVVGSPVAGRTRGEVEGLIGFFVNTLVLRTELGGDPSFRQLLGRVRETTLGAFEHQEVPFERLVEALRPERSLSHSPLFQVLFVLAGEDVAAPRLPGIRVEGVGMEVPLAKFDLSLAVQTADGRFGVALEYATDLFDAPTIRRMLGHLARVLEQVADDPGIPLSRVSLLADEERRALVQAWSATEAEARGGGCIHELFQAQAARTPDADAIVFRGARTSYRALDARASRLARHLRGLGVGPETCVGVCLERTPELIVSLLAVLKAGGAYVPLDPSYPPRRLGWMTEDTGVRRVLTSAALAPRLPAGVEPVVVDALGEHLAAGPAEAPASGVGPGNLSHVIFTSGSTGRPKGVMVRHAGAVARLHWLRGFMTDEERAGVLGSTSVNFDVSVAEIFGALCWGGTLVLVENALELPADADPPLRSAFMVPSAAAELLRAEALPPTLRTLILAGEALTADLAGALYAGGTVRRVANLYGPTEDTTYSTFAEVEAGAARVRIGRPLAGGRAYVLDDGLRPVPPGLPGELWLAGAGVARGYAARPGLTAERFLPDPYGPPGARMYRTLDRARWTAEGGMEYLGRTDFQVKVRGYRIEPGEIECALRAHPGVAEAVVAPRDDAPGGRRLVAWVTGPAAGDAEALRAHLRATLPDYMVPSAFVPVERLPVTSSGKVDRAALPPPPPPAEGGRRLQPGTEMEARVAALWRDVLELPAVGVEESFFDAGGHSLLMVRLQSRLARELGSTLTVVELFQAPTVREMAARLQGGAGPAAAEAGEARAAVRQAGLGRLGARRRRDEPPREGGVDPSFSTPADPAEPWRTQ